MKNTGKNHSGTESFSVSEAGAILGVSIPTVKRMVAEGRVEGFRTPGGHLRILAESIEALREQGRQPRPVRDASPVLQNRRERLEEVNLDVQELRAKRELEKLRREEAEEAERREAEAEDLEREAAERREALALERARLERQQAQEQQKQEAEQRLAAFRCRWLDTATAALSVKELRWLSAAQRKEVLGGLEAEIDRRTPQDEPRMLAILGHSIVALMEPFMLAREAQERRENASERALWHLSAWATDSEKAQALEAARKALAALPDEAKDFELRAAAEEVIRPIQQALEKRLLEERIMAWVAWQLPWGSDDCEKAKLHRRCAEIIAGLPCQVSELEAKAALEATITETRREIEERRANEESERRRANLIEQGISEVFTYLLQLKEEGEVSEKELWDLELTADLKHAVEVELTRELTGDETAKEVKNLVRETVDSELF